MSKNKRSKHRSTSRGKAHLVKKATPEQSRKRMITAVATVAVIVIAVVIWMGLRPSIVTSSAESSVSSQVIESASDNSQSSNSVIGRASIHFPEPSFDFGTISQGDKATHTFVVQNTGDAPLKLIKAKGS